MPEMTAAEALARATEPGRWEWIDSHLDDSYEKQLAIKGASETACALRALGFVLAPVEAIANSARIKRLEEALRAVLEIDDIDVEHCQECGIGRSEEWARAIRVLNEPMEPGKNEP